MIASEKSHQNISEYSQILLKKYMKLIKKKIVQVKKREIKIIGFMIMLTRSSEGIFNPMHYTDY